MNYIRSRQTIVVVYFSIISLALFVIHRLINKIDLDINGTLNKATNTQITQRDLLSILSITLIMVTFLFILYLWHIMHVEIKKKNEVNKELEKLILSQEEFIVNISHELKTPLNIISSTTQLFEMYCHDGSLDEKREQIIKYIDSMKLNSCRLSKLVNNIIDSSKIKAGLFELNLSNNNIVEVVEGIVTSVTKFAEIKCINIIFDTDTEEKIIAFDLDKIERVVLNLISNALKFSDEGSEIFVDIKNMNEFVEISVKDNGIGIEANYLDMIFNKFKQVDKSLTRNAEGAGIGLSLVKAIVELHDGRIYVESEFGKGSKFTVMLPSRIVSHENESYSNKARSTDESVQVELSDIYS